MANFLMKVKCGDTTYNISNSGEDVYFSKSSSTGGFRLKGMKFRSNEIKNTSTGKPAGDFEICQAIRSSI